MQTKHKKNPLTQLKRPKTSRTARQKYIQGFFFIFFYLSIFSSSHYSAIIITRERTEENGHRRRETKKKKKKGERENKFNDTLII